MTRCFPPRAATRLALAIAAILGSRCEPLLAADLSWNAPTDDWSEPTNWSPAGPPTASDNAIIDNGGTAQVQSPGAITDGLTIGATSGNSGFLEILSGGTLDSSLGVVGRDTGTTGTVSVAGAGSLWRDNNFITIGNSGDGSLTIEDSGRVESFGTTIGGNIGGTGTVTVTGAGSVLDNGFGAFLVGFGGDGTLNVTEGGQVSTGSLSFSVIGNSLGSTGSVTVNGDGSLWSTGGFSDLLVAAGGSGTLSIENGGRVDSLGGAIGINPGVSGTVSVTGAGSQWNNNQLVTVGAGGEGELTIADGGQINSSFGVIGDALGSIGTATVTGAGSQWNNANDLFVGFDGDATLSIADGGQVDNVNAAIAFDADSTATVLVSGEGAQWNSSGDLFIGFGGDATLTIADGGQVNNTNAAMALAADSTAMVLVTGGGSQWNGSGDLVIGNQGDATLIIADGGRVDNVNGAIGLLSGSTGEVRVSGAGSRWDNSDGLAVGIEGDATLTIENGGQVEASAVRLADQTGSSGTLNIGAGGAPGVLDTPEIVGGAGSATLNFNHTDSDYFFTRDGTASGDPVVISGSTAVNHLGGGTTIVTGEHTYLGDTTVDNGTLLVNGTIASTSIVNTNGTLGGDGTLGAVGFGNSGGTIAPGNSIGTLTVDSVDFAGGGIYEVEVDAAGNADLLKVNDTANLAGGSLSILPMPGDYGFKRTYTILQATTVDDTFDAVGVAMPEFAFLDPSLAYTANQVDLTLERNDVSFDSVANTPNQRAVGSRIEQLYNDDPESIQGLLDNLFILNAEGANAAYDSLSGVQHTHSQTIVRNLDRLFQSLLFERLASGYDMSASHDLSLAYSGERWARRLGYSHSKSGRYLEQGYANQGSSVERGLWLRSFGGVGDIDATTNASGADYTSGGVAFGVDAQLKNDIVIGVAAGYARSDADTAGGSLDIDSYQIAGYAGWAQNDSYLNGSLGGGLHRTDARRSVAVGTFNDTAKGDYDTISLAGVVEGGHHVDFHGDTRLTPFVGIEYAHLHRDDFTETGAGTANLSVEEESQDSLRSRLGLRLKKAFTIADDIRITPMIEAAYVREYLDSTSRIGVGFTSAPDATFRIAGPELSRDRAQIGAGVTARFSERSSLNVGYQAEFAGSDDQHSLAATLVVHW